MRFKLLTELHLEFRSLTGGCTGSSESALVKMKLFEITCHGSFITGDFKCGTADDSDILDCDKYLITNTKF